tara:strand:- start:2423 stop:3100 length:678 start_codon:yes stop_codon:yes gene_type:complete
MVKKIFLKILRHITNPFQAIFFDVRKIYWIYAKFYLIKIKKIDFPKSSFLINIDYIDLLNLWNNINKRKPKIILEIGSGYSTILIVAAIKELKKNNFSVSKFYSLEQNSNYLNMLKKIIKKDYLEEIEFILTDLKIEKLYNTNVSVCSNFPNDKINFLYEDRADHITHKIAGDALKIEKNMPDDYYICIDGMRETVEFYKSFLKRKYKLTGGKFCGSNFEPIDKS